jgi:hypothetical protein
MEKRLEKEGYSELKIMDLRNEAMEEELVRGREFANQLGQLVITLMNHHHELAQHLVLVNNIINSFTNTLTLLNKHHKTDSSFISPTKSQEISQHTSTTGRGSYKRRYIY